MASNLAKLSYQLARAKGATVDFSGLAQAVGKGVVDISKANREAARQHAADREKIDTTGLPQSAVENLNPLLQQYKDEYFQASKEARNIFASREAKQAATDRMNEINFQIKAIGDSSDVIKKLQEKADTIASEGMDSEATNATEAALLNDLTSGEFWNDVTYDNGVATYNPKTIDPNTGEEVALDPIPVDKIKLGPISSSEIPNGIIDIQAKIQSHVEKGGTYSGAFKEQMENELANLMKDKKSAMAFAYDGYLNNDAKVPFIDHYLEMQQASAGMESMSPQGVTYLKESYKTSDLRAPMVSFYKQTLSDIAQDADNVYNAKKKQEMQDKLNLLRGQMNVKKEFQAKAPEGLSNDQVADMLNRGSEIPSTTGGRFVFDPETEEYLLYNKGGSEILGVYTREQLANSLGVADAYGKLTKVTPEVDAISGADQPMERSNTGSNLLKFPSGPKI